MLHGDSLVLEYFCDRQNCCIGRCVGNCIGQKPLSVASCCDPNTEVGHRIEPNPYYIGALGET